MPAAVMTMKQLKLFNSMSSQVKFREVEQIIQWPMRLDIGCFEQCLLHLRPRRHSDGSVSRDKCRRTISHRPLEAEKLKTRNGPGVFIRWRQFEIALANTLLPALFKTEMHERRAGQEAADGLSQRLRHLH